MDRWASPSTRPEVLAQITTPGPRLWYAVRPPSSVFSCKPSGDKRLEPPPSPPRP